jgi:hypothetical protein
MSLFGKLISLIDATTLFDKFKDLLKDGVTSEEFKLRMKQLDIDESKVDLEEFKEKKGLITKAFHLVFPFGAFVLICMYIAEFYLKVDRYILYGVWETINFAPHGLELIVLIFCSLLMPKKLMEVFGKLILDYFNIKFNRK